MKFWEALKLLEQGKTVMTSWGYTHSLKDYDSVGYFVANDLAEEEIDGEWREVAPSDRICRTCFHLSGCKILDAMMNTFDAAGVGVSNCSHWKELDEREEVSE